VVPVVLALVVSALVGGPGAHASGLRSERAGAEARILQIFYRSPVLVRRGETVRIPVDVVCSTGTAACAADATLSLVGTGDGGRSRTATAAPGLEFDLTRAAGRATSTDRVDFRLSAAGPGGARAVLPAKAGALHLYVTRAMPAVHLPAVPFGRYRRGRQVAFLPWGSGPANAGLSPGDEAATLGPSSFAVAPDGAIVIADVFHHRLLTFAGDRLVGGVTLPMSPQTDLSVGSDGRTFVASDLAIGHRRTEFTTVAPSGVVASTATLPAGVLDEVGTDGSTGFVHILPVDAWSGFPESNGSAAPQTGLPLAGGGTLLRSVVGRTIRLGIASESGVAGAVELRSGRPLGDLALAAPDGAGGYVAVVRVLGPAGDQYEVAHVARDRSVTAFAVPSGQFAGTMPHARFRLGPDGALYQMTTRSDGVRIVRYGMGGAR
jgi:hypothetical protein